MSLRRFYEEPYQDATSATCSEPSITRVVTQMLEDYAGKFESILDVGCGAELAYDLPLASCGVNVVAADFAFNFLRLAPRADNISLTQADAEQLAFLDSSFDAVICSETLEHVPDDQGAIKEIARVLKSRGLLFFTVPNYWNASRVIDKLKGKDTALRFSDNGHLREYSKAAVKGLIEPLFTIERFYPVPFDWHGLLGSPIDFLITHNLVPRLSKSIALVARKRS